MVGCYGRAKEGQEIRTDLDNELEGGYDLALQLWRTALSNVSIKSRTSAIPTLGYSALSLEPDVAFIHECLHPAVVDQPEL